MGRPLFSTLYTLAAPAMRIVEGLIQTYERWSDVNAFDPGADEFFKGDNCLRGHPHSYSRGGRRAVSIYANV